MVNVKFDAELELIDSTTNETEFVRIYIPKITKTKAEQLIKNEMCKIPQEQLKNAKFKILGINKWMIQCGKIEKNEFKEISHTDFNDLTVIPQNGNCKYIFLRRDGTFRIEYPYFSKYVKTTENTARFINKMYAERGVSSLYVSTTKFSKRFKVDGKTIMTKTGIVMPVEMSVSSDLCSSETKTVPCEIAFDKHFYVFHQKIIEKESAEWDFFN